MEVLYKKRRTKKAIIVAAAELQAAARRLYFAKYATIGAAKNGKRATMAKPNVSIILYLLKF